MRLAKLKTATLKIEQASLTGEAVSVMKRLDPVLDEGCELQVRTDEPALRFAAPVSFQLPSGGFSGPADATLAPRRTPGPQAKECMLFASTTISSGQAVGIVTDIGMQTEIG